MTRPPVVLVGGCHRDVVARTRDPFRPGTSCPGRVAETAGGVARNVAVLLAGAGLPVALVTRVGEDEAGRGLVAGLAAAGVDVSAVVRDAAAATGTYVAVHDEAGELVAAVSDLAIYDALTPPSLAGATARLSAAGLVFADANLPAATLDALAAGPAPMAVDAVSEAKAPRVVGALRAGALGFVNLPSAAILAAAPVATPADGARALARLGARRAVVTGGARPVAILVDGAVTEIVVPPAPVVDVTGAGDALTAGTLAGLAAGTDLPRAVRIGIAAAAAALARPGALDKLPPSVLQAVSAPADEGDPA